MTALDGFSEESFAHDGVARPVYRRGEGPGVLIMHEVPGITPPVMAFARRVADEGFAVAMPHLFGVPGKPFTVGYNLRQLARACVVQEFSILASRQASPITDWLRALARALHKERGGPGVGALGMCITRNFALTLYVDSEVMAPVLSQPSLPFAIGPLARGLHISDEDLAKVQGRVKDDGGRVLGLRFTHDRLCPAGRFAALNDALGDGFEGIEIDSSRGNPHGIKGTAHSVLTEDLVDEEGHPTRAALERVLAFFRERLT
jgi:dienelactone hydrolase